MQIMVDTLSDELLPFVESIWCDSKATATYSVVLLNCGEETARAIAGRLEIGCFKANGGHNGIYIQGNVGADCSLDPEWLEN